MNDLNPRAIPGGNNPPPYDPDTHAALQKKVDAFNDAGKAWLDLKEIASEGQSEKLTDFVSGARKLWKEVDTARSDAKRPHDDAGAAVQNAYKPLLDLLTRLADKVKPLQTAWLAKLAREEEERKAALRREEEAKRKAAEEAAAVAAATNDTAAEVEAERLAKEAADAAKAAAKTTTVKAGSATGAGRSMSLRTIREVEIVEPLQVFMRFRAHPEMLELLKRLAEREVRAADWPADGTITGAKITTRQVAV